MTVHIFDVDQTVIRKTSAQYFIFSAIKEKIIRLSQISRLPSDWVKYKLARPDLDFIDNTIKKLAGIKKSDLERVSEICFTKKIKQNIYTGAAQMIRSALDKGEKVIFATSSFNFIIKPLEDFFGIQGSLATKMEFKDGITTGKIDGYSFFGPKKKIAVLEWIALSGINLKDVSFYSDSYTDIPLLEVCSTPVAVNPDKILKKNAIENGWQIVKFKEVLGKK
ncbi:MAG: HAD-IB family hydrolase [Treponema sp.]|nr:HAD-IB family hydrolase [Treponema sp.]MCL2250309.1 HAD-IB family hydrolase [Treponema sp.]